MFVEHRIKKIVALFILLALWLLPFPAHAAGMAVCVAQAPERRGFGSLEAVFAFLREALEEEPDEYPPVAKDLRRVREYK